MLSPHDRTSLFEALRPPEGYVLEAAVGTSFTLDLEALLTAPIAFALYEASATDPEVADAEPVGLLEAIRRHAGRITLFCQAGQIAVPARRRTVFAWLEDTVVEVGPPRPHRLFHPKVWLVRYHRPDTGLRVLRVLCATRNLTFDTSWDTLLRVESDSYETQLDGPVIPQQAQLAEFFRQLPDLALRTPDEQRQATILSLADDLERVALVPPEPFTWLDFHVLGLDTSTTSPFPEAADTGLVISPFLGGRFLERLADRYELAALISREESLDRLDPEVFSGIGQVMLLSPAIDVATDRETDTTDGGGPADPSAADEAGNPSHLFGGLHAKLYLFDTPDGTRLFTGSANATTAAFDGNVEVLAELHGPPEAGVAALLAGTPGERELVDLLIDYTPRDEALEPSDEEELALHLDVLRREASAARFDAVVAPDGDAYVLTLTSRRPMPTIDADELDITVWPVTLDEAASAQRLAPGALAEAVFSVTLEGITAFFAVRAQARRGRARAVTAFLVNARLDGVPDDRHSRLLAAMLRDPDRLLRYLLMLLHDPGGLPEANGIGRGSGWLGSWVGAGWDELPLLELLLRALDRHPDRLDHIDRLLHDLADERERILPDGFDVVWEPVWRHHREGQR